MIYLDLFGFFDSNQKSVIFHIFYCLSLPATSTKIEGEVWGMTDKDCEDWISFYLFILLFRTIRLVKSQPLA